MNNLQLVIGPRYQLPEALSRYNTKQVISIFESAEIGTLAEPTPEGITYHRRHYFDDAVAPDLWRIPPSKEDVLELIREYELINKAEPVYIHCFAGISRSTATAYTLNCIHLGAGKELEAMRLTAKQAINKGISPNKRIVEIADALLGRNGAMITALEAWEDEQFKSIDDLINCGYIVGNDDI